MKEIISCNNLTSENIYLQITSGPEWLSILWKHIFGELINQKDVEDKNNVPVIDINITELETLCDVKVRENNEDNSKIVVEWNDFIPLLYGKIISEFQNNYEEIDLFEKIIYVEDQRILRLFVNEKALIYLEKCS